MQFLGDQRWLVFVLPGFVALFVAGFISDFPAIRDVQLPIVYVALTTLSVSVPLVFIHIFGILNKSTYSLEYLIRKPSVIVSIFLTSITLGFLFGIANTTDYVSIALRDIFGKNLVIRSSMSELRQEIFRLTYQAKFAPLDGQPYVTKKRKSTANRYARFNFASGQQDYEGVVTAYSGTNENPEVYLSPACLVSKNSHQMTMIMGPGVWLNLRTVQSIEIYYDTCSKCAAQVEIASGHKVPDLCPFH